jgi:hypothetical protein
MSQTLRTTFSFQQHSSPRRSLVPAASAAGNNSLEDLLAAMRQFISRAKTDLLQPRQQAVDFILREAAGTTLVQSR